MAVSRVVDRVGQVLGGRYRLVAPIGTGASASVYLADDVTLRRRVAVKILHDALADDVAFLKRFRAEAQAAAALNHPHVMAVYDWGHNEVPYLVTEYLGGGSLRSMLDLDRRLSLSQALLVGLEAARGLEYAHRHGFVHRDIKPANLLFDDDGRLRIADFGLARALAEAAWTEPMGAVLGTARYASPEQARGEVLDGRSDVYSLALVIQEAVTGSVPFTADTTLGTLMARVGQPVPVSEEFGPLRQVLEQAGDPDPDRRPDAGELANLLLRTAPTLDRPAPLPLAGAMPPDGVDLEDRHPTTVFVPEREAVADLEPDIMLAPPGTTTDGLTILHEGEGQPETRVIEREESVEDDRKARRRVKREDKRADRAARDASDGAADGAADGAGGAQVDKSRRSSTTVDAMRADDGTDEGRHARKRRWPRIVVAAVVVIGLAGGGWGYWWYRVRVPTFAVPQLVGRDVTEIDSLISGTGWEVQRDEVRVDGTVPGQIVSQRPEPGSSMERGSTLAIAVSLGPTLVDVPGDLAGMTLAEVTELLDSVGLAVGVPERRYDEDVPADTVIDLVPGTPAQVPKGGEVGLIVSDGPEPRTVPAGLAGETADAATAALKDLGLKVATTSQSSETVKEGLVISTAPGAGAQVPRGATVTLVVSSGPPTVVVPEVRGLSAAEAANKLQGAGLVVSSTEGSPANPAAGTKPQAGTTVRRGTSVIIVTG